ncbi:MAG: peptidase sortase [Frankiales bacterium]|nr:peptidase sortase [Frankiales bacterium]
MTHGTRASGRGLGLGRGFLIVGAVLLAAALAMVAVGDLGGASGTAAFRSVPVVNLGADPAGSLPAGSAPAGLGAVAAAPGSAAAGRATAPKTLPAGATLRLDRLGLHAALTTVDAVDGVMQVPADPRMLGWWADGAALGARQGTIVVVGHVNYAGVSGALAELPDARLGDVIDVAEAGTELRYRVTAVRTYPKSSGIPAGTFSQTAGGGRLVLITCGGPFDPATGSYEDNIVAYADRS